jgi:hypothetical protein
MTSHVTLSNGAAYILDCGLGVTDRFAETGIPFNAVRSISSLITIRITTASTVRFCWSAGSMA